MTQLIDDGRSEIPGEAGSIAVDVPKAATALSPDAKHG